MKKSNVFLLILFIILGVYLNFYPHLNYKYPLHVDEWVHYQYSNYLSSNSPLYFGGEYKDDLESGFHFLLATSSSLGISYLFMFNYFPSLIFIFICLGFFILTRRLFNETAGVFSVLFIALLKSTVMILGLVFLVPMALGIFLIAIGLFLIKINSKYWFLILSCLLIMHPPSAMAFLLLINLEFLILRKNCFRNIMLEALGILIASPIYFSIFLKNGFGTIEYLAFEQMQGLVFIPSFITWFVTGICIAGIYFSLERKNYSILTYSLGLLFFIFIFYHYKLEFFIPYRRALMYFFFIFSIAFGIGFSEIINLSRNRRLKILIFIALITITLIFALPLKLKSNDYFYHIIEEKDYLAFEFIKNNTSQDSIAIIDPWKANAFTPIAQREVYSRIVQGPSEIYEKKNKEVNLFFKNNCSDMDFLKKNNISIVYGYCPNTKLRNIYENVYVVELSSVKTSQDKSIIINPPKLDMT